MIRVIVVVIGIVIFCGCGTNSRVEEKDRVRQELQPVEQESTEPVERRSPDGAFGAKDYATDAREAANQETEQLESAVDQIDE